MITQTITSPQTAFPDTEAVPCQLGKHNGHNIDYIDNAGQPQSIFVAYRSWDAAKLDFERRIDHVMIIAHRPANMCFE